MTWVKLDDGFPDHPKIALLSPAAAWLHVCGLCYCNRLLTDGEIPKGVEKRLTNSAQTGKLVRELVERGVWMERGASWWIHDYLQYQPSKEKVLADREAATERQRLARERKAAKASAVTEMSQRDNGVSHGHVTAPRPDPARSANPPTPQTEAVDNRGLRAVND